MSAVGCRRKRTAGAIVSVVESPAADPKAQPGRVVVVGGRRSLCQLSSQSSVLEKRSAAGREDAALWRVWLASAGHENVLIAESVFASQ